MEESPEAHMETDVTSTTQDVPDTQEVTGSNGHVEMVIVVEKLEEDDDNISSSIQKQRLFNESTPKVYKPREKPSQAITQTEIFSKESPIKELIEISQERIIQPEMSPKPSIVQTGVNSPQKPTEGEMNSKNPPIKLLGERSPQKVPQPESLSKQSPIKDICKKSPQKISRLDVLPQNSPIKDLPEKMNSPIKDLSEKLNSPDKDFSDTLLEKVSEPDISKKDPIILKSSPIKDVGGKLPLMVNEIKGIPVIVPIKNVEEKSPQIVNRTPTLTSFKNVLEKDLVLSTNEGKLINKEDSKNLQVNNDVIKPDQIQEAKDVSSFSQLSNDKSIEISKSVEISPNKVEHRKQLETSTKKDAPVPVQILPAEELIVNDSTEITAKVNLPVEKCTFNGKVQSCENSNDSSQNTSTLMPVDITIERENSNDSQLEVNSIDTNSTDMSEKEHNKSISRELKSLIKSAKESKIISACTQLTSKRRKSTSSRKSNLDTSINLNNSTEADKIHGVRRTSINSQKSNSSEKSEKIPVKRSMRSQNPEFVNKVKQFLSSVTGKYHKDSGDDDDEESEIKVKDKRVNKDKIDTNDSQTTPSPPKIKKVVASTPEKPMKLQTDLYCWRCHWTVEQTNTEKVHPPLFCTVCPRSFHYKCLTSTEKNKVVAEKSWVCPECMIVLQAENSETRSQSMKKISLSMLCDLLKYALERMMDLNGVGPFMQSVDRTAFPDYDKYVVHPMDLSQMQANIADGLYGSTEAFLADANWILHNSIIFNTMHSKLTASARAIVRSCRTEMGEIEACPECYAAAHARKPTWFTDVCTTPHILLWAKLKGFPYWPAKGMSVSAAGHVDVRFFGAHDRAWVPAKDCFLYSEKDPNNFRTKRQDIIDSMKEAEEHIRNISRKYGKFVYPPFKTQLDTTKLTQQLKIMIPTFEGELRTPVKEKSNSSITPAKKKRRSHSTKSSTDMSEAETHENEQSTPVPARKMADGAEIARVDDEANEKSDNNMEVIVVTKDEPVFEVKSTEPTAQARSSISRKRRHSDLEEAVITIMESSNKAPEAKRKKSVSKQEKEKRKLNSQDIINSGDAEKTRESPGKAKDDSIVEVKMGETTTKEDEPPSSTKTNTEKDKNLRVTPIRIAFISKDKQHNLRTSAAKESMAKIITSVKDTKGNETTPTRQKSSRTEKAEKDRTNEKSAKEVKLTKSEKRRNSRNNRSLNGTPTKTYKVRSISLDKKIEKSTETSSSKEKVKEDTHDDKEKTKENNMVIMIKEAENDKSTKEKRTSPKPTENSDITIPVKDRIQFDDDTTLAVIARESRTVIVSNNTRRLPTISSVRSLSTIAQNTSTSTIKTTTNAKSTEVTIDTTSVSCTLTHTSADKEKDSASKLQSTESMVGRVGVRAFARMTSPDKSPQKNDHVQVEIKAEPIDVDDPERQIEKLNLMNAFRLRPVNPQQAAASSQFTEVKLNKVVVTPMNAKKTVSKAVEVKPRAKKSFPQPKKPEDSQLNSKNSMVYIPIQPPMTQAPVRPPRVVTSSTCPPVSAKSMTCTNNVVNSLANTITTSVMPTPSVASSTSTVVSIGTPTVVPGLGQVPAAVHTVPLMTSVNGQWMFSLQPIMSVGALDSTPTSPMLNGVAERTTTLPLSNAQNTAAIHNVSTVPGAPTVPPVNLQPVTLPPVSRTPVDSNSPGDLPRLQQRPSNVLLNPLDANTPIGNLPTPSTAGPLTAKLNQSAAKLADFFRTLLEDSLEKLDIPATHVTALKLQLEQAKWHHQTEMQEIKHNHELTLAEMRALFEKEKLRAVAEVRRAAQLELEAAIKTTKAKQWCANCSQEAQFYCCWNTSYCDYPCQRAHWSQHYNVCTQQRQDGSSNGEPPNLPDSRLQPQPDNLPKNTSAPTLTVGGKLTPSRIYTQEQSSTNTQKSAIIVSMVEDKSGNQTMKCVGTYKSNPPAPTVSPVVLNKQIMNNEENANKKVVSSGGYLIVGGNANNSSVVTQARQGRAIHYYT